MLGLPVALWGLLSHGVPYGLTALAVRLARPEPDVEATYKLAAGVFLYPLAWMAEGWAAWRLGGGAALALFIAALAPSGFFALGWSERLDAWRATRARGSTSSAIAISTGTSPSGGARSCGS